MTDMEAYQAYRDAVPGILAAHGGRFIVRAGTQIIVEGTSRPRTVVVEFPTLAAAQSCYESPEYQSAKGLRTSASTGDVCIVEGWE